RPDATNDGANEIYGRLAPASVIGRRIRKNAGEISWTRILANAATNVALIPHHSVRIASRHGQCAAYHLGASRRCRVSVRRRLDSAGARKELASPYREHDGGRLRIGGPRPRRD